MHMHISTRTLIEVLSAAAAVTLIVDANRSALKLQKWNKKAADLITYQAKLMERENFPFDQFDSIAVNAIIDD